MEVKKQKILESAGKLILKYGVKSMTMDDIARELGISKKTLYLYVEDKNDLIKQVIELDMKLDHDAICSIVDRKLNAIDENFEIFKSIIQNVGNVPPNILYDLKKYHPEAYEMHKNFMWTFSKQCIEDNLKKGILEGYYRQDINSTIISTNYILMVNNIFETIIEDQKIIKIDSTKDLHSFDLGKFQYDDCNNFDLELISALTEINNEVSKPQNLLLGVSDYLCNKTFCDKFKSFVFYAKSNESHYGNAIELITIDNNSNSFHKITLSQEYLSEGYEYTLESKFKTKSKVEITKKEFFNISDNIKDNDSISAKRKVYQIKSNGQIIEI